MNIISDINRDARSSTHRPGSYEWWYFDAVSADQKYSFVVIFYEGNPFSRRYISSLKDGEEAMPGDYPAISISVYEKENPIYYSFTELDRSDCRFQEDVSFVQVGSHQMRQIIDDGSVTYQLHLEETLPSGDKLEADITFKSPLHDKKLFEDIVVQNKVGHQWNLVQPRADVNGKIHLRLQDKEPEEIKFTGKGYHDHNAGLEPMHNEFQDWYWGRFHFEDYTLVYYVMNRSQIRQHRAWLISAQNEQIIDQFEKIQLQDKGVTLFGLMTARKINLQSDATQIRIQQSTLLDNGPFYQRFRSEAFLNVGDGEIVEATSGISEYIFPSRIYARIFWPFVNMRIYYKAEGPHWVQKSPMLYRWTW